jgi:hypothetical protein
MPTGDDLAQARSVPLKHERDDARLSTGRRRQAHRIPGLLIPTTIGDEHELDLGR